MSVFRSGGHTEVSGEEGSGHTARVGVLLPLEQVAGGQLEGVVSLVFWCQSLHELPGLVHPVHLLQLLRGLQGGSPENNKD